MRRCDDESGWCRATCCPCVPQGRHRDVPSLPSPGRVARGGRRDEASGIQGPGVLGAPAPRIRGRGRSSPAAGPGTGGARWESNGSSQSSREIDLVTGSFLHSGGRASPTSLRVGPSMMASACTTRTLQQRFDVRPPPTGPPTLSATLACPSSSVSCRCSSMCASSSRLASSLMMSLHASSVSGHDRALATVERRSRREASCSWTRTTPVRGTPRREC